MSGRTAFLSGKVEASLFWLCDGTEIVAVQRAFRVCYRFSLVGQVAGDVQ